MTRVDIARSGDALFRDQATFVLAPVNRWRALSNLGGVAGCVTVPVGGFLWVGAFGDHMSAGARVAVISVCAVLLVPCLIVFRAVVLAVWRPVLISAGGVTIRNVTTTKLIPMGDVVGFEIGRFWTWKCPILRMTAGPHNLGRSRPITGMNVGMNTETKVKYSRWVRGQVADMAAVVDAMNAELDRRRGTSVTTAERLQAARPKPRAVGWGDDE